MVRLWAMDLQHQVRQKVVYALRPKSRNRPPIVLVDDFVTVIDGAPLPGFSTDLGASRIGVDGLGDLLAEDDRGGDGPQSRC
jgi:hypothetical protein